MRNQIVFGAQISCKVFRQKGEAIIVFLHIGGVWNFWTHWSEREVSKKLYVCHYDRNSRSQKLVKIGILKNFTIFTGKYLYWSLFLIKRDSHKCFPVNFAKLLKTAFFIEHWLLLLSRRFVQRYVRLFSSLRGCLHEIKHLTQVGCFT